MNVPASGPPPLTIETLSHWFGENEARKQVLYDIRMALEPGKLTVLVGSSGSGKTTLLTLAGCLRKVQSGSIVLLGQELNGATESQLVEARRQLGFIFQAHNLHESLTATQNVRMGLDVHGHSNTQDKDKAARYVLTLLGLEDRLDYLPANLSGGQKQRVAIARALVGNPQIIFADEPTAALDKENTLLVVSLLKELGAKRGTTTFMVTHNNRILELADCVMTMDEGKIIDVKQS